MASAANLSVLYLAEKTPSSRKRPKYTMSTELGQISKRNCTEDLELCKTCESIDFLSFFSPSSSKNRKLYSVDIFHAPSCPFCRYLANKSLPEGLALLREGKLPKFKLQLGKVLLPAEEYLQAYGIERCSKLSVQAFFHRASECRFSCQFDLCSGHVEYQDHNSSLRMLRTPIPLRFEPEVAKSWLAASRGATTDQQQRPADASLGGLINQKHFRVLDVKSGNIVLLHAHKSYVALSYVWGQSMKDYSATQTVTDERAFNILDDDTTVVSKVDLKTLQQTLLDAANLVGEIGERYLWVDALCIYQHDTQDRVAAIGKMNLIYNTALLTIIAADGDSAHSGLSRLTTISNPERPINFIHRGDHLSLLPTRPNFEDCIEHTTWDSIGWTYQERILSHRCLIFTKSEVLFTCTEFRARESYSMEERVVSLPKHLQRIRREATISDAILSSSLLQRPHKRFQHYRDTVEAYTQRILSHPEDRLDAFTGILDYLYPKDLSKHHRDALGGLLSGDLFYDSLRWEATEPGLRKTQNVAAKYCTLPSWNWVGHSVPVNYSSLPTIRYAAPFWPTILDRWNIQCIPTGSSPKVQWEFEPLPCPMKQRGHVVLHLWRPVFQCHLKLSTDRGIQGFKDYDMIWPEQHHVSPVESAFGRQVGIVGVDAAYISKQGQEFLFDILILNPRSGAGLLIEKDGEFHRRIGIVHKAFFHDSKLGLYRREMSEFQHIKLI